MKLIHSVDVAALQNQLQSIGRHDIHQYLLLDGSQHPKLLRSLKKCGQPWISVFTQSHDGLDELQAISPLLVTIGPDSRAIVQTLLEICDGLPMASLWQTPETLPELAQRLYPWCVVNADGSFFNLRYADTRRLRDVDAVISDIQRGQFYGPALDCFLPDRLGAGWHAMRMADQSLAPAEKVTLDTCQTHALISAAEADEVLYQLHFHSRIQPAVLADCHDVTLRALHAADLQGIADPHERISVCLAAITSLAQSDALSS